MTPPGFGDLARTVPLTRHGVQARADLSRLGQELTTGRHQDVAAATRGDLRAISGIERTLALLGSAEAAATAVQGRMGAMQAALEGMQEGARQAASAMLAVSDPAASAASRQAAHAAKAALGAAISALSARMGGVHLFSGAASDSAPLPSLETMLDRLRADVAPNADPAALRADVEAWFDPGGPAGAGLNAFMPAGADEATVLTVAPGETLTVGATAADAEIRSVLAGLAYGVLVGENHGGALDAAGRREGFRTAGAALMADDAGLTSLRGRLGIAEGQSERSLTRVRAEANALEIARGEALEVDRYETATKLQAAEAAVETLYLVTARLSGLSLANYLR